VALEKFPMDLRLAYSVYSATRLHPREDSGVLERRLVARRSVAGEMQERLALLGNACVVPEMDWMGYKVGHKKEIRI
jgi:hypothetical protein